MRLDEKYIDNIINNKLIITNQHYTIEYRYNSKTKGIMIMYITNIFRGLCNFMSLVRNVKCIYYLMLTILSYSKYLTYKNIFIKYK